MNSRLLSPSPHVPKTIEQGDLRARLNAHCYDRHRTVIERHTEDVDGWLTFGILDGLFLLRWFGNHFDLSTLEHTDVGIVVEFIGVHHLDVQIDVFTFIRVGNEQSLGCSKALKREGRRQGQLRSAGLVFTFPFSKGKCCISLDGTMLADGELFASL